MKISVLGLGNWGTALANHLGSKGHSVLGWTIEPKIVEGINSRRSNPVYLSQILISENVTATTDLKAACETDLLLLVLPSAFIADVLAQVSLNSKTIILSCVKGLEPKSCLTPLEFLKKDFPNCSKLAVLSGPGFAKDIAAGKPAGTVIASTDEALAILLAELFTSQNLKVYTSTDTLGVELGGILKNVIALAVGVSDGLNLGDSARASLITRGLAEMMRLGKAMHTDPSTMAGLSGMGDLILTATCDSSRNRTVGIRLGQGEDLATIIKTLGSTAEAVKSAEVIVKLSKQYNVEMPITEATAKLIQGELKAEQIFKDLMSRPSSKEF